MQEPIETIIICAPQNFEIVGGLNPVQIKIEDDRVLNILNKYKIATYKLTPLGILFLASIKNNTEQVFITCRNINKVKKALINSKIYSLIGITDLKKINNCEEIKGQSTWINVTLEEQNKMNNSRHLCFPFSTKTLNDLLSFSIFIGR